MKRSSRAAYTLVELLIAISVSSILLLGLGSVMTISMRTLNMQDSSAAETSRSAQLVSRITADLKLALDFSERTASAVTFTVPDRDGDDHPEQIRYEWTGAPNNQLLKTLDFSNDPGPATPVVIAEDVTTFDLNYLLRTWGPAATQSAMEGTERLLIRHEDAPTGNGNNVLFVVRNKFSLTAQESARKNLMESLGFDVITISQNSSQSSYDFWLYFSDLVYVAEQVNDANVAGKIKSSPLGIVSEKIDLAETFGLGKAASGPVNARIVSVSSGTNYITSGFVPGALPLFSSNQPVSALSNNPSELSPDLRILTRRSSNPSLVSLNKGDKLYSNELTIPGILGYNTVFPTLAPNGIVGNWQAATQVILNSTATVESISAYINVTANSQLRFGIYSDVNGEPGALIAETGNLPVPTGGAQPPQTAWYTIPLPQQIELSPGTYWMGMALPQTISFYYESGAGQTRTVIMGSDPLLGLMPNWSGTYPSQNDRRISIYANVFGPAQAPGRRVQLPWGGAGFDINSLTSDGKKLFKDALFWAGDRSPDDGATEFEIRGSQWAAQYFRPTLPANATGWSITRAYVAIKPNAANGNAKVRFRIQSANLSQQPGATVFQETDEISLSSFAADKYTWYEIPFRATEQFAPTDGVCLVVKGTSVSADAKIKLDINQNVMTSGTHFISTTNQGATWSTQNETQDLRFYIFGKHYTQGEPASY